MSSAASSSTSTVAPSSSNCVARALREVHGPGQRARLADHVHDVRRGDQLAVDQDAADRVSNDVCATTRTLPLTWIASAPAVRSSWIMSTIVSTSTVPSSSVIVTRMPGPGHRHQPGHDRQGVGLAAGPAPAPPGERRCSDCRSSRVRSSRAISASARCVVPARPLRTSIRSCSRRLGVGVVDRVEAHLGDRGVARAAPAAPRRSPGRATVAAARRAAGRARSARPAVRRRAALAAARRRRVVRHGRGAVGSRRRWRRSGSRGRR